MRKIIKSDIVNLSVIFLLAAFMFIPGFARAEGAKNTVYINTEKIELTDEEKEYIKENPTITIAMDTSWIPYAFPDHGEVNGVIPNILDNVADRVGLKVEYVAKDSYADAIAAMQNKETMLVSGIANDNAMAEKNNVLLTVPYIQISYSAVTKKKIPDLYASGASYNVAVCDGSYSTMAMKEKMPSYHFIEYHSNEECMEAVENDEADVALIATNAAAYYNGKHRYLSLQTVLINDFSWGLCFGVSPDCNPMLIEILNKGIAQLSDNDVDQAIYSGLIDATNTNRDIGDLIYCHPIFAVAVSGTIIALLLVVVFVYLFEKQKLKDLESRKEIEEDRDQKDHLINQVPSGVGIFEIIDGELYAQYRNDSYYCLLRDTREARKEKYGDDLYQGVYKEDRVKLKEMAQNIDGGRDQDQCNYRSMTGEGEYIWLHVVAAVAERMKDRVVVYSSFYNINDTIKAHKELEKNSELLNIAIKSANMNVWEYDFATHQILRWEKAGKAYGFSEDLINVPDFLVKQGYVHEDSAKEYRQLFLDAYMTGKAVQGDFYVHDEGDTEYYWEHVILSPFLEADNSIKKAIGATINITDRKEKERRYLRQIESMAEVDDDNLIAKGRHDLSKNRTEYYCARSNGAVVLVEDQIYDDAVEKLASMAVLPEKQSEIRMTMNRKELIHNFYAGKVEGCVEYRRRMPDGSVNWTETKYSLYEEPNNNDIIVFLYSYDITNYMLEKQIISKLSSLEYDMLGLVEVDTNHYKMMSMQDNLEGPKVDMEGNYDDVIRRRLAECAVLGDRERLSVLFNVSNLVDQLEKGDVYSFHYSVMLDTKQIRRKNFQCCYLDNTKTSILFFRSDVTDIYTKEQEQLLRTENALQAAEEASSAKTEFFSRMSHDMRTPMNGILGLAELCQDEEDVKALQKNIHKIQQSGKYLLGLINDTLDFQKIESGKMTIEYKVIMFRELVESIVDMVRQTSEGKGVDLRVINRNMDLDWYVKVDPMRMKQIFVNLLSNAIKFTPTGGTIELGLECLGKEGMMLKDMIWVRDTGIGMSEDFIKNRIFQPFSQEHNNMTLQYAGTGLGLSIAKKLVEMMNGSMEVESEVGVGTVFRVYIDLECVDVKNFKNTIHADEKRQASVKEQLVGKHILLVEDHPLNAEIAQRLLEKTECIITWKKNGQEAVDEFKNAEVNFYDIILMDIRMPVMDGLTAAKKIRKLDKLDAATIPILAMTANAYDNDVKISKEAGMNDHLSKPIDPKNLYETIAKYV